MGGGGGVMKEERLHLLLYNWKIFSSRFVYHRLVLGSSFVQNTASAVSASNGVTWSNVNRTAAVAARVRDWNRLKGC
jgi:hypothetical protein